MQKAVLFSIIFLLTITTHAQNNSPQYQLRTPAIEEYLRAFLETIQVADAEVATSQNGTSPNNPIVSAMTNEIYFRYPELWRADYELLYEVYQLLLQRNRYWNEPDIWNKAIVLSWLNQNAFDLNSSDNITFFDYQISVTPRDFNADGQDEWLLHVEQQDFYRQDVVVTQDGDGYRLVESPLPWFGGGYMYYQTQSGFTEEQRFEDLNGDGLPEWVLALGGVGGGHLQHGWLYILQWQDGQLVDLAPKFGDYALRDRQMIYESPAGGGGSSLLFPNDVTVTFDDHDSDGAAEIVIAQEFRDTWGCEFDDTRIFGWRDNQYDLERRHTVYSESPECMLRHGQAAMWNHNYNAAVTQYERALVLYAQREFDADAPIWEIQWAQAVETYVAVRLALAYSLVGRTNEAAALLTDIPIPDEEYPPIATLTLNAQQAYAQRQSAFDLCLSVYDTFADYHYSTGLDVNPFWGVTLDNPVPAMAPGSGIVSPDTIAASCDIEHLLTDILAQALFTTNTSLIDQLNERGVTVGATFQADLNGDGVDEWLVWLPSRYVSPLFFTADGVEYRISRPRLGYFDEHTELATFQLPDDAGIALMRSYFDADRPIPSGMGGPYPQCYDQQGTLIDIYMFGDLSLWRMNGYELTQMHWFTLCQSRTISEIFPDGMLELHGWIGTEGYNAQGQYEAELRPGIFTWDSEQQRYVQPPQPESTLTPVTPYEPPPPDIWGIWRQLDEGEYTEALSMVETRLSSLDGSDLPSLQETRFYYALTLEALNRHDDALTQYIAIYDDAPESAWGQLAALHLEPID